MSDSAMVETTDTKDESQWKGQNLSKLLQKFTLKQCIEYLISGYIKANTTTQQFELYSSDLQQVSIEYLGNIFYRFNPNLMDKSKMKMKNEYCVMVESSDSNAWVQGTALIDLPIPINDDLINIELNIKINAEGLSNGHYFVGIVHDKYDHFHDTVWMKTAKCFGENRTDIYGVCGNHIFDEDGRMNTDNIIWNGERGLDIKGDPHDKYCKIGEKDRYKTDDVINIEYDGKSKQLILSINNNETKELLCNLQIVAPTRQDIKYFYPAISLRDHGDFVEIMNF